MAVPALCVALAAHVRAHPRDTRTLNIIVPEHHQKIINMNTDISVKSILRRLQREAHTTMDSFIHLASDGVLRVYDPDFNVLSAAPLEQAQVQEVLTLLRKMGEPISLVRWEVVTDGMQILLDMQIHPPDEIISEAKEGLKATSSNADMRHEEDVSGVDVELCEHFSCLDTGDCEQHGCFDGCMAAGRGPRICVWW